jgi:hypothetical protein
VEIEVVKKILDHLGIYEFGKKRAPPKAAEDQTEIPGVQLQVAYCNIMM